MFQCIHNYLTIHIDMHRLTLHMQKFLNNLGNYIPSAWNEEDGCLVCGEWRKELPQDKGVWPVVVLAVFIEKPSPFLAEMLERVTQLDYPKNRMSLFVHNAVSYLLCKLRN